MKSFTVAAALTLMAALTQAAPAAPKEARAPFMVALTFYGAGPKPPTYFLSEPADNSQFVIGKLAFAS